jgi:hypothetical protein
VLKGSLALGGPSHGRGTSSTDVARVPTPGEEVTKSWKEAPKSGEEVTRCGEAVTKCGEEVTNASVNATAEAVDEKRFKYSRLSHPIAGGATSLGTGDKTLGTGANGCGRIPKQWEGPRTVIVKMPQDGS